jgi:hypothetical protein
VDLNAAGGANVGDSAVAQDDSLALDADNALNNNDLSNNQQANNSFNDSSDNSDNSSTALAVACDSFNDESDNSDNSDNSSYNEQKVKESYNATAEDSFNDDSTNDSNNLALNIQDNNVIIAAMSMEANGSVGIAIGGVQDTCLGCAPTAAALVNETVMTNAGNNFAGINSMNTATGYNNNAGSQTVIGFTISGSFQ